MSDPWTQGFVVASSDTTFPIVDFATQRGTATANATGVATITFGPDAQDRYWLVERIALRGSSNARPVFSFYVGDVAPENLRDYTPLGNADISDEVQPIRVPPGSIVTAQWVGCTPGALMSVNFQTAIAQRKAR